MRRLLAALGCAAALIGFGSAQAPIVLKGTNDKGEARPLGAILDPSEKLRVEFDREAVRTALTGLAPSDASPEAKQAAANLREVAVDLAALRDALPPFASAVARFNEAKPGAEREAINPQIDAALAAVRAPWRKLRAIVAQRPALDQAYRAAAAGTTDLFGSGAGNGRSTVGALLRVLDDYVAQEKARLFAGTAAARVPLRLEVRLERDPNFLPRLDVGAPVALDSSTLAQFKSVGTPLLSPDTSDRDKLSVALLQVFGLDVLKEKLDALVNAANGVGDAFEAEAKELKALAASTASAITPPAGADPGMALSGIVNTLNTTLLGTLQTKLTELDDAVRTSGTSAPASVVALRKALQDTVETLQNVLATNAEALGIRQSYQEIARWSQNLDAQGLEGRPDVLQGREVREGDRVTVRLMAQPMGKPETEIGDPRTVSVYQSGWYRRDEAVALYAFPLGDRGSNKNTFGIAYNLVFHKGDGESVRKNAFPATGYGLSLAVLNFDNNGAYEFGAGGVLTFLNDFIHLGGGYNFNQRTPYLFVGLQLRRP